MSVTPEVAPGTSSRWRVHEDRTRSRNSRVGWWRSINRGLQTGIVATAVAAVTGSGALLWLGGDRGEASVPAPVPASARALAGMFTVKGMADDACDLGGSSAATRVDRLTALMDGQTFPCPQGPGGGYSDIGDGTTVSVSDGNGNLLGTGSLSGGIQKGFGVEYRFRVEHLPDSAFYKIQVANRGELPYSRADLEAKGWSISASLG